MKKLTSLQIAMTLLAVLVMLSGCATDRYISPSISEPTRTGLDLNPPVLVSVFDGRANQEPKEAAFVLQKDLTRIYGHSIYWNDYFTKTPPGRVAIRVRIVTLGASFGSRLVSSTAFASAVSTAQAGATGPWGPVVGNVSAQQSVTTGSFSGEGWWNGAAWVDVEVQDYRSTPPVSFTVPIVAEHRESNMWGYASGDKAVSTAWQQASVQLTRAMDSMLRSVRDGQQ